MELKASIDTLVESLSKIITIIDIITTPSKFWNWAVDISLWVNIIVVCICVILYAVGHTKAPKWGYTTTFICLVIRAVGVI